MSLITLHRQLHRREPERHVPESDHLDVLRWFDRPDVQQALIGISFGIALVSVIGVLI